MNNKNTVNKTFTLGKLGCGGCAKSVENILKEKQGVVKASADFETSSVVIEYNPDIISPEEMRVAVQDGGYDMYI
ncbi:heavy-metal-associated domain-containing protein [Dysgonomonas sp. Marseille-P4677]|uniref:heavy-metal-associated domain-containing protein n=1 Tax=Dysgonomonas sp. Marseille-P4677 TaxID=2364790 RepID=UPI001F3BC88D|nr:heavy metal-associated domain-containing protein [Dysgonomonas sp. Marseille-P4677]